MLTNPQAMTFQKINIAVYHQHKSDKIDHEILKYHLRGKCTKNTARGPTQNPEALHKVRQNLRSKHLSESEFSINTIQDKHVKNPRLLT